MKIKEVQAVEKIIKSHDKNTRLVVRYNNELLTADFKNHHNSKAFTEVFGDDISFAEDMFKRFSNGSNLGIHINEPINSYQLMSVIELVKQHSSEVTSEPYSPEMLNIHSLTNGYDLPFISINENDEIEVVSIVQDETSD